MAEKFRHYTPSIQNWIGARIDEVIALRRAQSLERIQKSAIVEAINLRIDELNQSRDKESAVIVKIGPEIFSRLKKRGNIADDHVSILIRYFDERIAPGFAQEIEARLSGGSANQSAPLSTGLLPGDLSAAAAKDEFRIFEAAFLWHGVRPPSAETHWLQMTQEISDTKDLLHVCCQLGLLEGAEIPGGAGFTTVVVSKEGLTRFADAEDLHPRFLFPDSPQDDAEMLSSCQKLQEKLKRIAISQLVQIDDWAAQDAQDHWLVYEAAFLWHGYEPPPVSIHWHAMTDPVSQTKQTLHNAIDAGEIPMASQILTLGGGSRYVGRDGLRAYAESIGQRPRFLFPEEREHS